MINRRIAQKKSTVDFAFERSSGVLLHPTSLPRANLGDDALRFIDWLVSAGQRWWQVLPLGPPDTYGSPYASASAFAGSPQLLAKPEARVTASEIEEFVAKQWYWASGWARHQGRESLFDQVRFEREWTRVRTHASDRGIKILGDVPFYVARHSADQEAHPGLFDTEMAAGVPPDDWSTTGQLWGNPIYNWPAMRADNFRWWVERFRRAQQLMDAVRIDHFRGFAAYWAVPLSAKTAIDGKWYRSPGRKLFSEVATALGDFPIVAENLGVITPAVEKLRRDCRFPGAVVLQFTHTTPATFAATNAALVDNVVYTGTHDNDTANGWWKTASQMQRHDIDRSLASLKLVESEPNWKLIQLALRHPARIAIMPAQDILGLSSKARMNVPGKAKGNWKWQLGAGELTPALARRLHDATESSHRLTT